jgi:zinc transport system permease protein
VLGAVALAVMTFGYRALAGVTLDEEGARVQGLPVDRLNALVAVLAATTVALSMRVVGVLLVAALMVLPVIAAGRVARSMLQTLGLAIAIGLGSVVGGLTISYYGDQPPGGTIVLVAAGCFVLASVGGLLTGRR